MLCLPQQLIVARVAVISSHSSRNQAEPGYEEAWKRGRDALHPATDEE